MSAFEFFFSFYGLLLGLSVAAMATGLAMALQHRKTIRIGYLTPLLAGFVALDIASFWDSAWTAFRDSPFSYGLLVAGLLIALVYFIATSLIFPYSLEDGQSLDDHFWANKRVVLLLTTAANLLMLGLSAPSILARPHGLSVMASYGVTLGLYVLLIVPAALTKRPLLFTVLVGLHTAIYMLIAVRTLLAPGLGA